MTIDFDKFTIEDGVLKGEVEYDFEGGIAVAMLATKIILDKKLGPESREAFDAICDIIERQFSDE